MHSTSTECSAPDKQQGSCTLGSQPSLAAAPHQGFCSSAATDISSCTATGDLRAKHKRLSRQNKALVVQAPAVAASESLVPADLEWAHQMGYYVVLTLGVLTGALLFAYACAYHWYVVHDNPLALREIPLPGLAWAKQPLQPAHAQGDELASWEELALQHGSEAVIILSDSNHRQPILVAQSAPSHLHSDAVPQGSTLPEAAFPAGAAASPAPAAVPRAGFLGRMAQHHHSKHAGSQEVPDRPP